jgi:cbb3-type cytochrome oxidase maturation protein
VNIIFLLIPVSLILIAIIAVVFFWAVKSGQYDDLEAPRHRILMDDDDTRQARENESGKQEEND